MDEGEDWQPRSGNLSDINVDPNITPDHERELKIFCKKIERVFSNSDFQKLRPTNRATHRIHTGDAEPVQKFIYRQAEHLEKIIKEKVEKLLEDDLIRRSKSAWRAPVVIVKKKTGGYRFCVDFRGLNKVIKNDSFPIPRIDDVLDTLHGAKYFTTLDCTDGYWQVPLHPEDAHKTAFGTRTGLYEWKRMPMGLKNSAATFQRTLNLLFSGLTWNICLIYIDDILIFSNTWEEHMEHLEAVFVRLSE